MVLSTAASISRLIVKIVFLLFLLMTNAAASDLESLLELELEQLLSIKFTTASRSNEAVQDAPAKVAIITRQQIHERGYINLFDLLRGETSIDTQAYAHETNYNTIAIRGIEGNNKFLIQQNGIPVNSPAGDPVPVAGNYPLFNAVRVEVVYGPASSLYGADAFSGVINIITDTAHTSRASTGTYLGEDNYRYAYALANYPVTDNVSINFSGHVHQSDNPDLSITYPDVFFTDRIDFTGATIIPASQREAYYGDTNSHSLSLTLNVADNFTTGFYQSLFKSPTSTGIKPGNVDYSTQASWSSLLGTVFSRYSFDVSDKFSARILISHSYYEVDPDSKFNNLFSDYNDGFKYARADKTLVDMQFNVDIDKDDSIVFGSVLERITSLAKTADLTIPYKTDQTASDQALFYGGTNNTIPVKIFETVSTNIGAYLQHRRSWSEYLDSILGVRYDNNSRYGSSANPRLALIHRPNQRLTTKLLYGEAFLAPAPEFTFEHFGVFTGTTNAQSDYTSNFFFIPNVDLEPEEVKTLEANFSYIYNPNLIFDFSLYRSEVDRLILSSNTALPVSDFIDGGDISATAFNDNIGQLSINGAEFSFSSVTNFIDSSYKFWGNYSYTDGELLNDNNGATIDLPFVAKSKIKLGLTYRYQSKYYVTPIVYWIDNTNTDFVDVVAGDTKNKTSRSYTFVGLNAGIDELLPGLSISLKVDNLLDREYYNARSGVSITLTESPQNPRQIVLGLNYKF